MLRKDVMPHLERPSRILGPLLALAAFAIAIWLLHHELRHYSYHDIRKSLATIPTQRLMWAAALTVANYVVLIGYDVLSVRYLQSPLALSKITLASFIGHGKERGHKESTF